MGIQRRFRSQAAVIALDGINVCLINSRHRLRWVIPKGCMEPGKTYAEIALQEAWEEAGLIGSLHPEALGTYLYRKCGNDYRVAVFLMMVSHISDEWPEQHERTRRWLQPEQAIVHIEEPGLRRLIRKVTDHEIITATA